jgi:hypothetical protein
VQVTGLTGLIEFKDVLLLRGRPDLALGDAKTGGEASTW